MATFVSEQHTFAANYKEQLILLNKPNNKNLQMINSDGLSDLLTDTLNSKIIKEDYKEDYNKSQIRSLEPNLNTEMFKSFGCDVALVDGHDVEQLIDSMCVVDKPKVVLANTVKGKGIKEIEKDMFAWHHRAPTDEEYEKFIEVIG